MSFGILSVLSRSRIRTARVTLLTILTTLVAGAAVAERRWVEFPISRFEPWQLDFHATAPFLVVDDDGRVSAWDRISSGFNVRDLKASAYLATLRQEAPRQLAPPPSEAPTEVQVPKPETPRPQPAARIPIREFPDPSSLGATGKIQGLVVAEADQSALPGADIQAIHEPTNTRYQATSAVDGRFRLFNVRFGGPYQVTASLDGFATTRIEGMTLRLRNALDITFELRLSDVEEVVIVVSESTPLINSGRTGAASHVSTETLESLPTIGRSFNDFARTNPFFTISSENADPNAISIAGRSSRYNSISIDGSVNNDLFGLADGGRPGTTTISLDSIQELELVVTEFDVRNGGFSGGGINTVTRSGSNTFKGSLFTSLRDQDLVGESADGRDLGGFEEDRVGFRAGGPIVKDKAFFFSAGELARGDTPSGWSVEGDTGQRFARGDQAARFAEVLLERDGHTPGGLKEFDHNDHDESFFLRFDFNLSDSHNLKATSHRAEESRDRGQPSMRRWLFPDRFTQDEETDTHFLVAVNSVIRANSFNEASFRWQALDAENQGEARFPATEVWLDDGSSLLAGTDRSAVSNTADANLLTLKDDLTVLKGNHAFSFGIHNELHRLRRRLVPDGFGHYRFDNLEDFEQGLAQSFERSFSNTEQPAPEIDFDVLQIGLYAGDTWHAADNLTLVYGLRYETALLVDEPANNPVLERRFGLATDQLPEGLGTFSPRFGFNWDIGNSGRQQLRGGLGVFTNSFPYIWLANAFLDNGTTFTRLSSFLTGEIDPGNNIPFVADPDGQPDSLEGASVQQISVIDSSLDLPRTIRGSLAYDHQLPFFNLVATAEAIFSSVEQEITYENLNLVPTGEALPFDGRPTFTRRDTTFRDVIQMTNTGAGDDLGLSFQIERPYTNGLRGSFSYAFNASRSVNDARFDQFRANWRSLPVAGDPNRPGVTRSDRETRHHFAASLSYTWRRRSESPLTLSAFYNHQSGLPYSTTFRNDANSDFEENDLLYVPRTADEVILLGGTWEDFNSYIEADDGLRSARGRISRRNASHAPWTHRLDLRLTQKIPVKETKLELELTVVNLLNLLDRDHGQVRFVRSGVVSPVDYEGIDDETGRPIYRLLFTDPAARFDLDDLRSRWQAKVGLRWSF